MKPDSSRLVAIDALVIAIVSAAICFWSDRLVLMTILVSVVILLRHAILFVIADIEGVSIKAELAFWLLCTMLGAFNDWNTVVHHRVYDYTVPHFFAFTTIPIWMLLFWGMILRFFARLAKWDKLNPPAEASNKIGIGKTTFDSAALKIILQLVLIAITRHCIYRLYLNPFGSWLPFLAALILYLLFTKPTRHDFKLIAIFIFGGPLIEILYIQVGGLHTYHLGWIGGVPLWIALWWLLAIVIWKDLAFRIERILNQVYQ